MNRLWPITVAFLSFIANGADLRLPSRGLEAMFTVTVTDENNAPVDDATIEASFVLFGERLKTITSKTDTHGMVVVTGRAIERVIFRVYGKGFYPSRMEFPLLKSPFEANRSSIDAGKWLPWNQAISIKLLRNEAAEYTQLRYASVMIPTYGKTYGMDLKEGVIFDFESSTNSLTADYRLRLDRNTCDSMADDLSYALLLTVGRDDNRVRLQKQNGQSRYLFPTILEKDGWTNNLCFAVSKVGDKIVNTFPDRGYRGYQNSVLVPEERECVVFAFNRDGEEFDKTCLYAAVAPRFDISSSNILNMVWFTSAISNGVFTTHATGF